MGTEQGRRRKLVIAAVAVVAIVVLAVLGWMWFQRDTARPVTIDEARDKLTTSTTEPSSTADGAGGAGGADGAPARPAAGVYQYTGTGEERLSLPPLSQSQGPTIPATVEHLEDGCWSIRFDYSTNHWQSWSYCADGDDLVETGGESWQRWMVGTAAITNLTSATCESAIVLPAERRPDQVWQARCVATNEAVAGEAVSAGPYTFVGEEELDIGGTTVTAAHFVRERTMSGSQDGTERSEVWFAVDTGLPLRNERDIRVETDTPIGRSTYTETADFILVDPDPTG